MLRMDAADEARRLEEELEDEQEDRDDVLLEAAKAWQRAENHNRAIELLTEVVTFGEDTGSARVSLAESLFAVGRTDEARAQLDVLRKSWPESPDVLNDAAWLMERRGELEEALTWFDLAIARLDTDEVAESYVTVGRRRVRRRLGLPPDELDKSVEHLDRDMDALVRQITAKRSAELHLPFWPRAEVLPAHEKWPEIVPHADADAAVRARELANRELAESGRRIVMVPVTAARLTEFASRTGRDPLDQDTRAACIQEILADDLVIAWPPARNAPCWCGSGRKYKKCCGQLR